jgi:putative sterol carrier protein
MTDVTAELFEGLRRRGHEALLQQARGTLRFEIENGRTEYWVVALDRGDVAVSRKNQKSDCTVHAAKQVFDGLVTGEVNAMAAVLRGDLILEGDPELFLLFQRLFPGPVSNDKPDPLAGRE